MEGGGRKEGGRKEGGREEGRIRKSGGREGREEDRVGQGKREGESTPPSITWLNM